MFRRPSISSQAGHITVGRVGVLRLAFEQSQNGEIPQPFMGGKIVFDQTVGYMSGCQYAAQGTLVLKIPGRADAGQHGGRHVAEEKNRVFMLAGKVLCDSCGDGGFAAAGAAPHSQYTTLVLLLILLVSILVLRRAGKDATFFEVQHQATSSDSVGVSASVPSESLASETASSRVASSWGVSSGSGSGG